ncbi:hypothetical protein EQW76_00785 [Rhizobium sp. rho-13.1]|uniref:hypothetical protein n=1 Tax=Rhizobium sp. rho-13.1 TaxID=2506431 RepID=UPI00115DDACC|nr:hypothetical protein [Rhizobium sp. rho-13.1]TQX91303.1 hypothetical protein EQW76_00785 [Rhizobium sp. rho-13.1]
MHIVVSWDINEPASAQWDTWNEKLKEVLIPYAWVRPLRTVYVVPIANEMVRQVIINGLGAVSRNAGGNIHVLISPAMVGGQYAGTLPPNLWPELNTRSK